MESESSEGYLKYIFFISLQSKPVVYFKILEKILHENLRMNECVFNHTFSNLVHIDPVLIPLDPSL